MSDVMLEDRLWAKFTSTVGLVVTAQDGTINVQSAEWTYAVARNPLTVAVVLHEENWTTHRLIHLKEFTVTLCSADQADLADFCGGFSGRDVHKVSSSDLTLVEPSLLSTPWIPGGVVALECRVTQRVPLPEYTMVIGEALQVHGERISPPPLPLVKHGGMYHLGQPIRRFRVTVGVRRTDGGIRVCAVSGTRAISNSPYHLTLWDGNGRELTTASVAPTQYGDLDHVLLLPEEVIARTHRVSVERDDQIPGHAMLLHGAPPVWQTNSEMREEGAI